MKNKNLNLHFVHKFVIIDHINRTRSMMEVSYSALYSYESY